MKLLRSYPTCIALGGGITAFILCCLSALPALNPWIFYIWVGFISMMLYFANNVHRDGKTYLTMFCSFLCGLGWGQLSNLINHYVAPKNTLLCSFLDFFCIVFLLLFIHIGVLGNTYCRSVPCVFFGLASTIGFYGRPDPLAFGGVMQNIDIPGYLTFNVTYGKILLFLILYFLFGLLFSFMIEIIADFFAARILPRPAEASVSEKK